MRERTRYESKYKLDYRSYQQIKNAIRPYMEEDIYTKIANHEQGYLVKSLYFDSFDYQAYREKDQGDYGRVKLRIRSYTDQADPNSNLSVEFKTKFGNVMKKFATFVSLEEYETFITSLHWPQIRNSVMEDFERLTLLQGMRPKTIVRYRREGFKSRDGDALRITLDHRVESAAADFLFQEDVFFKEHAYGTVVLEIKADMEKPKWLSRLVRDHELKAVSNSKYGQSIEISRPDTMAFGQILDKEDLLDSFSPGVDPGFNL